MTTQSAGGEARPVATPSVALRPTRSVSGRAVPVNGFRVSVAEEGMRGLAKGWAPTFIGYSMQMVQNEGYGTFYKGLVPLWGRQIPYTMMKFACFEKTCSKGEQLIVTFAAGYIAGVFCAIVSHPADTVVSKLNQDKTATVGSIIGKLGMAGVWKGLGPRIVMIGTLTALQWFIYDAVKSARLLIGKLGMARVWKGLGPRIVMIGTLTALQWFIYDAVQVWLRMPRPPPAEMPESMRKRLEAEAASKSK
ncbi:Phosphate transport protein [Operophtera brumata]|uniref:Phosphate transport protein n=1 Tax=Operophtera brumata TaxID=104452 RepID=A0A0L7KXC2_OPEBR|nr:Phosphate transport protein [Operophtera brumata]